MPALPAAGIEITVLLEEEGWRQACATVEARAADVARGTLEDACPGLTSAELSILLADDATLRELNRTWRGVDRPTDVLSFPGAATMAGAMPEPDFPGQPVRLGDIALAWETCVREAMEQGKSLAAHLDHLVVHGVLHLLGYDHATETEAARMEALEIRLLAGLGVDDPYRDRIDG